MSRDAASVAKQPDFAAALPRAIDLLPYGVAACDANGHLTFANRLMLQMLGDLEIGLPAAFWPERYLSDENGQRFHESGQIPLIKALDRGAVSAVKMYQRGADRQVQLLAYSNRVQDDSGKTQGAVGIFIPTSAVPVSTPIRVEKKAVVTPRMRFDYSQFISVIELAETIASTRNQDHSGTRNDIQTSIVEYISSRLTETVDAV